MSDTKLVQYSMKLFEVKLKRLKTLFGRLGIEGEELEEGLEGLVDFYRESVSRQDLAGADVI